MDDSKENVDLIFGNVYHTDAYYMCYAVLSIWFDSDEMLLNGNCKLAINKTLN